MPYDLIGRLGDDRSIVFAACDVVPGDSGVDFGLSFGGGYRSDVKDCPDKAGRVSDACYVGTEAACGGVFCHGVDVDFVKRF